MDTVSHNFKNVSFEDVGCSLCHKPHKSLECPSLRSIIEMEVSSYITPTDPSLGSSDSRSRSPVCEYGSIDTVIDLVLSLDHPIDMICT